MIPRAFDYYGGDDGLISFDVQTGMTQTIPLPESIAREGWQMGTAFDRKRNRALLVTLSGEGFLYSFAPSTQSWGTVASMRNRDFDCLEYHDADESVYGVTLSHEDTFYAKVIGLSASDGSSERKLRCRSSHLISSRAAIDRNWFPWGITWSFYCNHQLGASRVHATGWRRECI